MWKLRQCCCWWRCTVCDFIVIRWINNELRSNLFQIHLQRWIGSTHIQLHHPKPNSSAKGQLAVCREDYNGRPLTICRKKVLMASTCLFWQTAICFRPFNILIHLHTTMWILLDNYEYIYSCYNPFIGIQHLLTFNKWQSLVVSIIKVELMVKI